MLRVASAKVLATGRVVAMKPFIRRSSVGGSQLLRSISKYSTSGSVKASFHTPGITVGIGQDSGKQRQDRYKPFGQDVDQVLGKG